MRVSCDLLRVVRTRNDMLQIIHSWFFCTHRQGEFEQMPF